MVGTRAWCVVGTAESTMGGDAETDLGTDIGTKWGALPSGSQGIVFTAAEAGWMVTNGSFSRSSNNYSPELRRRCKHSLGGEGNWGVVAAPLVYKSSTPGT